MINLLNALLRRCAPAVRLGPLPLTAALLAAVLPACAPKEADLIPDTAVPVAVAEPLPPLRSRALGEISAGPVVLTPGSSTQRAVAAPEIVLGTGTFVNPGAASGYRA